MRTIVALITLISILHVSTIYVQPLEVACLDDPFGKLSWTLHGGRHERAGPFAYMWFTCTLSKDVYVVVAFFRCNLGWASKDSSLRRLLLGPGGRLRAMALSPLRTEAHVISYDVGQPDMHKLV